MLNGLLKVLRWKNEKSDEKPNIENAKKLLGLKTFNGTYTIEESNLIFKELEVLLNGTDS